jgi:cytochrome P450/NADPH-cytochrome P450 reductase
VVLAPGLLFFGCRHPESDALYLGELDELAAAAEIEIFRAYSRVTDLSRGYVQDRVRQEGGLVMNLLDRGGVAYVCGATTMAEGVRATLLELRSAMHGVTSERAEEWMQNLTGDRQWLVDVWASS